MSTDFCSRIDSSKQSRLSGGTLGNARNAHAGIGRYADSTIRKLDCFIAEEAQNPAIEAGQRVGLLVSRTNANSVDEYENNLMHAGIHAFPAERS